MPRIVGIFEQESALEAVVEQLQLNGMTKVTILRPTDDLQSLPQQLRGFAVPDEQIAEYRRRLDDQRWLLFVQVSAIELPTVQRALRSGQALDIDLLPETNGQ